MNLVPGDAATIVGHMCADARLRAMSFTGSTGIGRLIAAQCAPTMKRLMMELGGHAPLIVFADADLERAVQIAMDAKFATSGQDCLAANRIYVDRPILAAFTARLAERIASLKVGPGLRAGNRDPHPDARPRSFQGGRTGQGRGGERRPHRYRRRGAP